MCACVGACAGTSESGCFCECVGGCVCVYWRVCGRLCVHVWAGAFGCVSVWIRVLCVFVWVLVLARVYACVGACVAA